MLMHEEGGLKRMFNQREHLNPLAAVDMSDMSDHRRRSVQRHPSGPFYI